MLLCGEDYKNGIKEERKMYAEEKELTGYPSIDKPWLKYYSEEAINAKLPECTIYQYLWECNKNYLDNVALNYFGHKITFGEMFEGIENAAKSFSAIGIKQGDIVVMATVTTPETVYALYGLNCIGAIANMVDPRTSIEGIKEYIAEVNAEYIICIDVAYPKIEKAVADILVKKIVVTSPANSLLHPKKCLLQLINKLKGVTPKLSDNCILWGDFIKYGMTKDIELVPYKKDSCCVIVHTGGTTGMPKGVMLSNDNINALVVQSVLTGIDMKREHTWLDIMPPFIAYGVGMGLHLPLIIGMETILVPSFDAKKFDRLLDKHKPNHMVGVPSYWGTITESKKLKNADLSYIIAPTVGGDTMDVSLEKKANEYLEKHNCGYHITKGYGMTEVCAGVAGTVDENNEIGSVGVPFVKSIVSIFNFETGEEVKYGELGEVCISGPNIILGYYNNEEATNDVIRVHKDGTKWVHSGDMGYMNEKGSIYIVDRVKRMIVRFDGFKVFPSLIEKVITSSPNINACCVVGIQDTTHSQGRLPIAYCVLENDCSTTESLIREELVHICKKGLPEYAQPMEYRFCEKLPLTPIGKVDYRKLEEIS